MTSTAAIIGWPIAHSRSPAIHNAAFEALSLDWVYVPIAIRPDAADSALELLDELGVRGANVTMPFKRSIVRPLDRLEGAAERLGAVNTIVWDGDARIGHNTDGEGFVRAMRADGFELAGAEMTILGGGGAARAVALAARTAGAIVRCVARRPEQAEEVAAIAGCLSAPWGEPPEADLLVGGLPPAADLPPALRIRAGSTVVDLAYGQGQTPLLAAASDAGAGQVRDGLGMLIHQAALAFSLWTGQDAPLEVMTSAAGGDAPDSSSLGA